MVIEHVAIWTTRLEVLTEFYERFFGARAGPLYRSARRPFESRFLSFGSGARLELMRIPELQASAGPAPGVGLAHVAFSAGSPEAVDRLTETLRAAGHVVRGEPRRTGDGYYESVVLDPDANVIEITG